jgi:hypothetical protein
MNRIDRMATRPSPSILSKKDGGLFISVEAWLPICPDESLLVHFGHHPKLEWESIVL